MARKKELATLFVTLGMDDKDFIKGANSFQKMVKTWSKELAIAGAAITAALGFATKAALDEEVGINKLRQALKNVGSDYDTLSGQIEKNIAATQAKTNYGDGEQREALAALVGVTGTYTGSLEQLTLATDIAAAKDMDLVTASELVGRVVNGDTSMLKRYGIVVKEGASGVEALAQMQERYAGAAEAAADPLKQLKNYTNDLAETIGSLLVPILRAVIEKIVPIIKNFQEWIEEHPRLAKVLTVSAAGLGIFLTVMGSLGMILPVVAKGITAVITLLHLQKVAAIVTAAATRALSLALLTNPIGVIVTAVVLLGAAVYGLVKLFQKQTDAADKSAQSVRDLTAEEKKLTAQINKLNEEQRKNQAELENLKNIYDATKESAAGNTREMERLEHQIKNTSYALSGARTELEKIQATYDTATEHVDKLKSALSGVNNELESLTSPRLEGMQEYEDQIQAIQNKINDLQVTRAELVVKGKKTDKVDEKIEDLKNEIDLLEAQATAAYDEISYGIKETAEEARGLNKELIPQEVLDRIAALGQEKTNLEDVLATAVENQSQIAAALDTQKAAVIALEEEEAKYQGQLNTIKNTLENILWDYQQKIYATETIIRNNQVELEGLNRLKDQADKTLDGMLQDSIDIRNNLNGAGVNPVSNRSTLPQMDTGGVMRGPGIFGVGAGTVEVLRRYDGRQANGGITIHINNPVVREEQDIKKLTKAISRELHNVDQLRV